MNRQSPGKSRLFFIEFLIVLFFFLIIGTVCLRVFVAAHKVTQNADALAHAQTTAASIAEVLEAGESIEDYFPEAVQISSADNDDQSKDYQITWDGDFAVCDADSDSAAYTLTVSLDTEDHTQTVVIICTDYTDETVYELSVTYHLPLTREEVLS
ncbi:MAG: hypothetical protein LUG93_02070 [Lachnospiraceae bacterium]|nr:hypothetical protein [Lachnospiraceae bacterium]